MTEIMLFQLPPSPLLFAHSISPVPHVFYMQIQGVKQLTNFETSMSQFYLKGM